jgi:hypothetical protein
MKRILLAGIMLAGAAGLAHAADLPVKATPPAGPSWVSSPCTVTACTGFYFGGDIAGAGLSLDILGTALAGPTQGTTKGASFGVMGGYQYWTGGIYAGAQVFANYSFATPGMLGAKERFLTGELFQVGGSLAGILPGGTTTPTQGPITLNIPGLALVSPFAVVGAVQRGRNGLATGAGAEFIAGPGLNVIVEYLHVNYDAGQPVVVGTATLGTEDLVIAGVVKKF